MTVERAVYPDPLMDIDIFAVMASFQIVSGHG
jgi:hypothetical protein